jgi:hypothetical protein
MLKRLKQMLVTGEDYSPGGVVRRLVRRTKADIVHAPLFHLG